MIDPDRPIRSDAEAERFAVRPMVLRTFAAILRDTWREFLDAKVLYLLLFAIALLFGAALTGRIEPQPGGRQYLDIAARAMAADLDGIDIATQSMGDVAGRLNGSVYAISAAEPLEADLPEGHWKATLKRTFIPLVGAPETGEEITARFGRIADGQLWTITEIRETGDGDSIS